MVPRLARASDLAAAAPEVELLGLMSTAPGVVPIWRPVAPRVVYVLEHRSPVRRVAGGASPFTFASSGLSEFDRTCTKFEGRGSGASVTEATSGEEGFLFGMLGDAETFA